jgi:hypothetical protein
LDTETTRLSARLSPTSPDWAVYYKRAKETRRLGKGQNIRAESKRRRRKEYLFILASTAALAAIIAVCLSVLSASGEPEGNAAPLLPAHARRG